MGGFGGVVEFFVVDMAAADAVVASLGRHGLEAAKVVEPALHGDNAGAIGVDGRCQGIVAGGVFGAVFIAGEVSPAAVLEGVPGDRWRRVYGFLLQKKHDCLCGLHYWQVGQITQRDEVPVFLRK